MKSIQKTCIQEIKDNGLLTDVSHIFYEDTDQSNRTAQSTKYEGKT